MNCHTEHDVSREILKYPIEFKKKFSQEMKFESTLKQLHKKNVECKNHQKSALEDPTFSPDIQKFIC